MVDASKRPWELRFTVEVAARYHDWRRGTLGTYANVVRGVTLIGAIISLIVVNGVNEHAGLIIGLTSGAIAVVSLFDLVFGLDASARKHDELYRRCKEL